MGKNKLIIVVILCFMVFYSVYLPPRMLSIWGDGLQGQIYSALFSIGFWWSAIWYTLILTTDIIPPFGRFLNRLTTKNIAITLGVLSLVACVVLEITHKVAGLWWTWTSFGMQIGTVLLVYIFLEKRIDTGKALLLGLIISGIAMATWEIPYQIGMALTYSASHLTSAQVFAGIKYQISIELPNIFFGVMSILYVNTFHKLVHFNRWFWLGIAGTAILFVLWYFTGFKVHTVYDWETMQWKDVDLPYMQLMPWKACKAVYGVGLAMIYYIGGKNEVGRLSSNPCLDSHVSSNKRISTL